MSRRLLAWYDRGHRNLPWRRTQDPYRIWVSEIMLQQTRVGAVLEHYAEFFRRFPKLNTLAEAEENQVLAAWSGLGYYRRARSLHQAARVVVRERGGILPRTAEEWKTLPGIGRYTAAAIASIAFGEAEAVVDGNVERVLQRIFGWRKHKASQVWATAQTMLSRCRPGDYNQAIMELGATVCQPGRPRCDECPWKSHCATGSGAGLERRRPGGTPASRRRSSSARYLLAEQSGRVLLQRRPGDVSLMPGMWELPELNGSHSGEPVRFRHAILDTDYQVEVYRAGTPTGSDLTRWLGRDELRVLPLTGLCRKVLRHFGLL